jgi:hypothetical protein
MDEEKQKFKKFAIAAWKQHYTIEKFKELVPNPSAEGERAWREQYARALMPFGDNDKGFSEFVVTMPG